MSGGIPWITLPAGYLGSSFIGAALITCGFDTNASKVASLVMAAFFLFTLWWARRNWLYVLLIHDTSCLAYGADASGTLAGRGCLSWACLDSSCFSGSLPGASRSDTS